MTEHIRKSIDYNNEELKRIKEDTIILNEQIDSKSKDKKNTLYDNQIYTANIINKFLNNPEIITISVYSRTQAGKTGCMTSLIQQYVNENLIPIENIFVISGISDKEWKKDTIDRMPDILASNILHRQNINKEFVEKIRNKENILLIMDEIQIASKKNQTIHLTFKECGFYDLDYLCKNNIKIIQFSATPDGNIIDLNDWNKHSKKIFLQAGKGYVGTLDYIHQNRIFQYKTLENIENVNELIPIIESYEEPMYHLIRVYHFNKKINKQKEVIDNFKKVFRDKCIYNVDFLSKNKKTPINTVLMKKPDKHTFIFYCEILRCAKTQYKQYIGISYERISNTISCSSIVQGAIGRLTGYDDNGKSICYTDIESILQYEKLLDNNMDYSNIEWKTNTTVFNKRLNKTISTGTFNSAKHIKQLDNNDQLEPIIQKFKTQEDMIKWFKDNLNKDEYGRGPNRKRIESGFYRVAGATRKGKQIISIDTAYKERKSGLNDKTKFRSYPCYSDISDANTLEWWLIYYKSI